MSNNFLYSQKLSKSEGIEGLTSGYCSICNQDESKKEVLFLSEDLAQYSQSRYYHNYHILALSSLLDLKELIRLGHELESNFSENSKELQGCFYFLKGRVFLKKGILSEALISFNKAIKLGSDSGLLGYTYVNIASVYQEKKEFKMALKFLNEAEVLMKKKKDTSYIKYVYKNKALCYLHLKSYDESEFNYRKTIDIERQFEDLSAITVSYMDLANLFYVQYRDAEAIPLFRKALQFAKESKDPMVLKTAHFNMGIVEENRNNYKIALQHFKKYSKIQDSLKDSQRIWELAEQQKKIELQQKNTEITSLEKDKQIQQAAIEIKNQQRNLFLLVAIGLLLIAVLVAGFYRNSLQKNKLIQLQKESLNELNKLKDELFSVLAHDLRSPVHHLISVTTQMKTALQSKNHQKLDDLILYGSDAANKTYLLLDNLLHWVLLQNKRMLFDRGNINVAAVFKQIEPVFRSIVHMKQIDLITEIPNHLVAYADINSLKIIFRNLIDNAIKFTPENNTVFISAKENSNDIMIQIKDTGVGMDPTTIASLQNPITKTTEDTYHRKSTGLGLRLCVSFVKRNAGTLQIVSEKNKGTTITITLPKQDREDEKD